MIVTDLDGTLLKKDKSVSEYTLKTIQMIKDRGIEFCIATARPSRVVIDYLPFSLENVYAVCLNGAEIYYDKKRIFERYIKEDEAVKIIKKILSVNGFAKISFEINDQLFTNFNLANYVKGDIPFKEVDLRTFKFKPVAKILVKANEFGTLRVFEELEDYTIDITDQKTFVQISHKESGKLNGIEYIANKIGIEMEEIIAFGDDVNDLKMIEGCGIGVAMNNGDKSVIEASDIIAPSNEDDGVAKVLNSMDIFNEEYY